MKKFSSTTELFIAIKASDEEAYKELVTEVYQSLFLFALGLVKDNMGAQHVVIMALQNCWQSMSKIESYDLLLMWLYTTTRNLALNYLRSNKRRGKHHAAFISQAVVSDNTILNVLHYKDLIRLILEETDRMPSPQQLVIKLLLFENMEPKKIAQLFEMNHQTVLNQKNKAIKRLREWLKKQGYRIIFYLTMLNSYTVSQKKIKKPVFGGLNSFSAVSSVGKPYCAKYH